MEKKKIYLDKQFKSADSKSKKLILRGALKFFAKPDRSINRGDLKEAKKILKEIELWELKYGDKDYSMLKNNSILIAYLAYKFGEIVGLDEKEKSNVYIAALVRDIGKVYMCGKEKSKAYEYLSSPLKIGDDGFQEILKVLKKYPKETKKYLKKRKVFNDDIVNISFNYHFVYSNLFEEKYLEKGEGKSQQDVVLWFADSLSAVSFSSLDVLQRNYSKDRYITLFEGLELLREQTGDMAPEFWSKTSGATLMGVVLTMVVSFSAPSKSLASDYDSEEVVSLLNEYREKEGLAPLRSSDRLSQAALLKAKDMLEKDYWAHHSPSGTSPWKFITGEGYAYSIAGENLARGFEDIYKMKEALLDSPSHKQNIVDPKFEDIGVAVINGNIEGKDVTLVVQMFGRESEKEEKEEKKEEEMEQKEDVLLSFKDLLERIGEYIRSRV